MIDDPNVIAKHIYWKTLDRVIVRRAAILFFSLFTIHYSLLTAISAQDEQTELAPPPLRTITKDEKVRLGNESDLKAHTKLSIELMNERLSQAEQLNTATNYDGVFRELGGFQGILDYTLDFLEKSDANNGKVLDNFKRFEIGLRGFVPRLETIRRDLPLRYEDYVHKLIKYVRESRSKAIEPQFGNSVIPGQKPH